MTTYICIPSTCMYVASTLTPRIPHRPISPGVGLFSPAPLSPLPVIFHLIITVHCKGRKSFVQPSTPTSLLMPAAPYLYSSELFT